MIQAEKKRKSVTFSFGENKILPIQAKPIGIEHHQPEGNTSGFNIPEESSQKFNGPNSENGRHFGRFWRSVKPFESNKDEFLYRKYKYSQIAALTKCLSFTGSALCITSLILTSLYLTETWRLQLFLSISFAVYYTVVFLFFYFKLINEKIQRIFAFISSSAICVQVTVHFIIDHSTLSGISNKFEWVLLGVYCIFVLCPVRYHILLLMSFLFFILHTSSYSTIWILNGYDTYEITKQIAANLLNYVMTTISGSVTYFVIDAMHRTSFVETRSSLATKKVMEEELLQQERLLTSVLPKHVAEEIVRDFGGEMDSPFRKMYMMRHENVSILFADIVGFTAISSKCSAADLVQLLNDLFANFDKLSQKYSQLRLKILGDCYYCICGVPKPRRDHAALSIYMGLAMVEAIGYVRDKTHTDVNMRVGIHTGAVLGGVLGQRQWQFDVLGKDVVIANKMESSGVPGRVHVCHVTKRNLQGEFVLEEAKVGSQHSFVKENGLKTYLVKSVIIPFRPSLRHISSFVLKNSDKDSEPSQKEDSIKQQMDYLNQFQVLSKNGGYCPLTLRLDDKNLEIQYQRREQTCPERSCVCFLILLIITFCGNLILHSIHITAVTVYTIVFVILTMCLVLHSSVSLCHGKSDFLRKIFIAIEKTVILQTAFICIILIMVVSANMSTLISFRSTFNGMVGANQSTVNSSSFTTQYPYYYTDTAVLILIVFSTVTLIDHITKSVFIVLIFGFHLVSLLVIFRTVFEEYDQGWMQAAPSVIIQLCNFTGITISVIFLDRQLEHMSRKNFLTRSEINEQKQQVIHLKKKNEALVYNLLPPHVAKEFLGRNKQDNELYSHAYNDVGVMFAACPKFEEFYTETSINKDGLECLRFLNEIISDYDELLKEERFKSICKIKTIASTYMVASGLAYDNPKTKTMAGNLNHLDDLVQYAFAMKETLDRINSQSFNDFDLRIGINCGPVIAGVIGAKKPHYDIWGNTVNVASRMESTCHLGKIQVVQETRDILHDFGYQFQQRGVIKVKGKGELMTYFLTGNRQSDMDKCDNLSRQEDNITLPNQVMG